MQTWDIATLLAVLGAVGGGLRWFFGWLDRRAENKRKHEKELEAAKAALLDRSETMQRAFLDALRKIQTDADEKYERHRAEHLADTKLFAATLAARERKRDPSTS